jgi:hypothetical protein
MKSVRELDAGNLHVQFDERRGGNGLRVRLGESGERKRTLAVGVDNPKQNRASRRLYTANPQTRVH